MTITELLNKPYPTLLNKWKVIVSVSFFISFFLGVFQPFGLKNVNLEYKTLILVGYGLVTFILLVFNMILLPMIAVNVFAEDKWTVKKQIIYLLWIVLSIGIGNFVYSFLFSLIFWPGIKALFMFIIYTFTIAIFPVIAITFSTHYVYLKRNISLSTQLNSHVTNSTQKESSDDTMLTFSSGNQQYRFLQKAIVFLESDGNYIHIHHLADEGIKTQLIRNTMKNVSSEIDSSNLFKCHRAFIINLKYVEKISGNSQGFLLTIKHIEKEIPVSRNHTKSFKERISNIF